MIENNDLIKIIFEMKKGDVNYLIDNYSFSCRIELANNLVKYNVILEKYLNNIKDVVLFLSNIFTFNESKIIINDSSDYDTDFIDLDKYYVSLFSLNDEEKAKVLNDIKFDNYFSEPLMYSFKNNMIKKDFLNKYYLKDDYLNKLTDKEKINLVNFYKYNISIAKILSSLNINNLIRYLKIKKINGECLELILNNLSIVNLKLIILDKEISIYSKSLKNIISKLNNYDKIELLKEKNVFSKFESSDYCYLLSTLNINEIFDILNNVDYLCLHKYDIISVFYVRSIYDNVNVNEDVINTIIKLYNNACIESKCFFEMPNSFKTLLCKNKNFENEYRFELLKSIDDQKIFKKTLDYIINNNIQKFSILKYNTLSDENKMFFFKKYYFKLFDYNNLTKFINSFDNDNNKFKCLMSLNLKNKKEIIINVLNSINNEQKKIEFIRKNFVLSNSIVLEIISHLSNINDKIKIDYLEKYLEKDSNIDYRLVEKYINTFSSVDLKIKYAIKYNFGFNFISNIVLHNTEFIKSDNIDEDLVKYFSNYYKCDYNNLLELIRCYGNISYGFLSNENIIKYINLDNASHIKIKRMFDVQSMILSNEQHIDSVLSALLQKKFTLNNRLILNIFNIIKINLCEKNIDKVLIKMNDISNYLCKSNFEDIMLSDNIISDVLRENGYKNVVDFINDLYSDEKLDNNLYILNIFTNKYILEKRNEFVKNNFTSAKNNLKLEKSYEKKSFIREWIKCKEVDVIINSLKKIDINELSLEENELLNNNDILKNIILLKKGNNIECKNAVLKYMNVFNSLMEKLYLNKNIYKYDNIDCKILYNIPYSKEDILNILSNLDFDLLKINLLNDENLYDNLMNLLNKYKLIGGGDTFSDLSNEVDLNIDKDTVCSFINNFYKIYPNLFKRKKLKD